MGDDRNQCRSRAESDGKEKEVSPFVAPFLNNQLKYSQISDREGFGKTELWATTEFVGKTKSGPVRLCIKLSIANVIPVGHTKAESLCRRKWSVVAGMVWAGEGKNCP